MSKIRICNGCKSCDKLKYLVRNYYAFDNGITIPRCYISEGYEYEDYEYWSLNLTNMSEHY